jgi:hypothetical protein
MIGNMPVDPCKRPSLFQRLRALPGLLPILAEGRWLRFKDDHFSEPLPPAVPVTVQPIPISHPKGGTR